MTRPAATSRTSRAETTARDTRGLFCAVGGVLSGVFLAWAIPLWGLGYMRGRGAFDQHYYHIKVVRRFLSQWPAIDLSDYESATAPGYHLALAVLAKVTGDAALTLQMVASLFTLGMFAVIALLLARAAAAARVSRLETVVLALPLACSMYVIFPGVWLQPDNAAWLGVFTILMLALPERRSFGWLIAGAGVLAALAFVRQNQVWAAAALWAGAWLNAAPVPDGNISTLLDSPRRRIPALLLAVALSLPAFGVVAWLFHLWGGPVPPSFKNQHAGGMNLATPAFTLALIAVYSVFLFAWLWPALARLWRESRPLLFLAAAIGVTLAAIPETTFLFEPRSSGLWNLVRIEERLGVVIAGRTSPIMLALSGVGAVALLGWLRGLRPRERWLLACALLAFVAAQTANSNCWQRYLEPFVLTLTILMALLSARPDPLAVSSPPPTLPHTPRLSRLLGPLALSGALSAVTLHGLLTGEILRW